MTFLAFFPPSAAAGASSTDAIFLFLLAFFAVLFFLIAGTIVTFAVRFREGREAPRGPLAIAQAHEFEIGWTLATLLIFLLIFAWAAGQDFATLSGPGKGAMTVHVVAKQWMWKIEHPGGQREINTLHLPAGQPVRLILNSEDVIHSFSVPAFRVKKDLVPGHDEELWFTPTIVGTYPLYCTEFCGSDHSEMRGNIVVLSPVAFSRWLRSAPHGDDLANEGAALFRSLGCSGCHLGGKGATVRAPPLEGLYGSAVPLSDGRVIIADDAYIRDSILLPKKDVVASYQPVMPSFAGRVSEADLIKLAAYIRSLQPREPVP